MAGSSEEESDSNTSAKQKGKHLALAKYLELNLANEDAPQPLRVTAVPENLVEDQERGAEVDRQEKARGKRPAEVLRKTSKRGRTIEEFGEFGDTMTRPLEGLPNPWTSYPNITHNPEHKQVVLDPSLYTPNWRLKINDQCYDPVIAGQLNRGSVLPRDEEQFSHIPIRRLMDYMHVIEAEGRTMRMAFLDKFEEVYSTNLSFEDARFKMQGDLALRDGELATATNQRDNIQKMYDDLLYDVEVKGHEAKQKITELRTNLVESEKKFEEYKQHNDQEVSDMKAELEKLQKDQQTAKELSILEFKKSTKFKTDLVALCIPATAKGFLLGVEGAQAIWPNVNPEDPRLSGNKEIAADFNQRMEYYASGADLEKYDYLEQLAVQGRNHVVAKLTNEFDLRNENLNEFQMKYNEKTLSLGRTLEEKDLMHHNFCEETRRMQHQVREHVQRVLYEQEVLNMELENERKQLDSRSEELNKREALIEREKQKLNEQKKKREKEDAVKKILDLERGLNAKLKLEMEIAKPKGNIEVMKFLGNDAQNEIKRLSEELEEKIEEMSDIEQLNQALLIMQLKSNDEFQDARKALIMGLGELRSSSRASIGIKRMGEIDNKIFDTVCKQKFPQECVVHAAIACSVWQEKIRDTDWYPFKVITVSNGTHEKILDENDESLQELKLKWGDEVYAGVTEALKDQVEYNASGGFPVPELWNFKENRKAALQEVVSFIFKQLKSLKRKRK